MEDCQECNDGFPTRYECIYLKIIGWLWKLKRMPKGALEESRSVLASLFFFLDEPEYSVSC